MWGEHARSSRMREIRRVIDNLLESSNPSMMLQTEGSELSLAFCLKIRTSRYQGEEDSVELIECLRLTCGK